MAVRGIDVATPGRDWDRARNNRCCMRTGRRNRMRYTLHSVPRDQRKTVQRWYITMDLALLVEQRKDRDGVITWVYPLRISPTSKLNKIKSKI